MSDLCTRIRGSRKANSAMEHGDEWDAKIRRQIKECVLFIPLISANTQARLEGYSRTAEIFDREFNE